MIKEKQLKKKIMVESGMLAAFLVFLGVVAFICASISSSMNDDKNKIQGTNSSLMAENNSLQDHIKKASTSIEIFQVVSKSKGTEMDNYSINREIGKKVFTGLKDRYHLSLTGNNAFNQIADLTDEQFKKKTAQVVASDADMNFQSVSDEIAFKFIRDLYKNLPGFTVITSLQLNKQSELSSQSLVDLGAGKFPSLVTTTLKFKWIGLKPIQPQDPNAPAPAPAPITPGQAVSVP